MRVEPRIERNIPVTMRDGTVLRADVYLPPDETVCPVLVQRTPYNKSMMHSSALSAAGAVSRGYAVVVQDVRGRYASDGVFRPYVDDAADGYDTVMWAASAGFSSGQVGMYGVSYMGTTQFLAAGQRPEPLRAIVPFQAGSSFYHRWAYEGGCFNLVNRLGWTLTMLEDVAEKSRVELSPEVLQTISALSTLLEATTNPRLASEKRKELQETLAVRMQSLLAIRPISNLPFPWEQVPFSREWMSHEVYDEFWGDLDALWDYDDISVPALHIGGWYDLFISGTLENYRNLRSRSEQLGRPDHHQLIVGPWTHGDFSRRLGDVDFGEEADRTSMKFTRIHLDWFDRWMRPGSVSGASGEATGVPSRIFVMGENRWHNLPEFPPHTAEGRIFYLGSGGSANSLHGDGFLSASPTSNSGYDSFTFDPNFPVDSVGGAILGLGLPPGPRDQRRIEERQDVLVYTGTPLVEPLWLAGQVQLVLWATAEVPDTTFTAKLVDVHPDGFAQNLIDGILRTTYRKSSHSPAPVPVGTPVEYVIDLGETCCKIGPGHRLRLEVSSSNYPRFAVSLNSGEPLLSAVESRSVTQVVHHGGMLPSRLNIQVVPTTGVGAQHAG